MVIFQKDVILEIKDVNQKDHLLQTDGILHQRQDLCCLDQGYHVGGKFHDQDQQILHLVKQILAFERVEQIMVISPYRFY